MLSPYVYCANNPIKLVDPDGREIVGLDGKAVTYSYYTDGNVVWSSNASKDSQQIGNALLKTETGKGQLDKLISSDTKVTLKVSQSKNSSKYGEFAYDKSTNNTSIGGNGNINIKEGTITIYENSIKESLAAASKGKFVGGSPAEAMGAFWASTDGAEGIENYIGAVAGHEIEHVTSQVNIKLHYNGKNAEQIPDLIKTQILWESGIIKKK